MDISKTILSDPVNKWVFRNAGTEVFLVGGYIRDLLLGRTAYDKDYVIKKNAGKTARGFAKKFRGTFIELKEEQTYRVALNDRHFIDFNNLENTIEADLYLRDFTINAIAWSPGTGIIDPAAGVSFLEKKKITAISPDNLKADPLRVLRAYRIGAQLDFSIDMETRRYLRKYSGSIIKTAPERITEELFKLLNVHCAVRYLDLCGKDGVLKGIFGITPSKIRENLQLVSKFDDFMQNFSKSSEFDDQISQGLTRLGLIRLSLLLSNSISNDKGRNFRNLSPSNSIKLKVLEIHKGSALFRGRITDRKLFEIYRAAGSSVYELALIIASMRTKDRDRDRLINRADDYMRIMDKQLINGNEIQKILRIGQGVRIGQIQAKIKEGQFMGLFNNKREAITWIISNFT